MRLLVSSRLGEVLLLGSLLAHIHCEEVFGILGENYTFPVKINKKLVEIIWMKNRDKVAEWEEQSQAVYFTSLKNRGSLNNETGSLTIFNLEKNDTATYVLEYLPFDENNLRLTFILTVLDPPSEPTISCNVSDDSLVLTCAADFKGPLTYTWDFGSITDYKQQQQNIVFLEKTVDASEKVMCFIEVSQTAKSSEFSLTECFPGEIPHGRSKGGLIAACVVIIAAVIIFVILYKTEKKRSNNTFIPERESGRNPGCPFRNGRRKRNVQKHNPGDEGKKLNENCQEQSNSDVSDVPKSSPTAVQATERDIKEGDVSDVPKSSPTAMQADECDVKEGDLKS